MSREGDLVPDLPGQGRGRRIDHRSRRRVRPGARPARLGHRVDSALVVLHLHLVGAGGHGAGGGVGGGRLVDPLVDHERAVQVQAHAVVGGDGEGGVPGGEVEVPGPAHGEEVGGDAGGGDARAPVVVDRGLAAGERGRAGEGHVREVGRLVLAGGAAGGGRPRRPAGLGDRVPGVLVVLHLHLVGACGHGAGGGVGGGRLVDPLVDHELTVQVQAHAVVGGDGEGGVPGGEVEVPGPAHGEEVGGDAGGGDARAPVVVDRGLAAGERGRAGEGHVREVGRLVLAGGAAGGWRVGRARCGGWCPRRSPRSRGLPSRPNSRLTGLAAPAAKVSMWPGEGIGFPSFFITQMQSRE